MREKVSIVGAGNVGSSCAMWLLGKGFADIVLVDIVEGLPQGRALDLLQCRPILRSDVCIKGSNDYADTAGSSIVVITSGVPRKPGMSREDLLLTNKNIIELVTKEVVKNSPDCIIILVTNPLDAMTQLALYVSKFPRNRVLGQSGILDTMRFKNFISEELHVSIRDISALVLGGHGDTMVPLRRACTVGGIPLTNLLPKETIDRLEQRTIRGGEEIVGLLKTGSAHYAPSAAAVQMAEAILMDKKMILPCAAYLEGEYGISGVALGVPVKLGRNGVEQIMEVELTTEEHEALVRSAESVRKQVKTMKLEEV